MRTGIKRKLKTGLRGNWEWKLGSWKYREWGKNRKRSRRSVKQGRVKEKIMRNKNKLGEERFYIDNDLIIKRER